MEWSGHALVLATTPFGEGDVVASLLAGGIGRLRGLARGGAARARAATWQVGNLVEARWVARLPEQLGALTAELVHPAGAHAMADRLALAVLASACAVAEGALPEREPHDRSFAGLAALLAEASRLPVRPATLLPALARWELGLLAELGFGLDLAACAVSGDRAGLAFVSPRTGRAVGQAAAAGWEHRLIALPGFLASGANAIGEPAEWSQALHLTGHFLARDAFGQRHRPLPPARLMLAELVAGLAERAAVQA